MCEMYAVVPFQKVEEEDHRDPESSPELLLQILARGAAHCLLCTPPCETIMNPDGRLRIHRMLQNLRVHSIRRENQRAAQVIVAQGVCVCVCSHTPP